MLADVRTNHTPSSSDLYPTPDELEKLDKLIEETLNEDVMRREMEAAEPGVDHTLERAEIVDLGEWLPRWAKRDLDNKRRISTAYLHVHDFCKSHMSSFKLVRTLSRDGD